VTVGVVEAICAAPTAGAPIESLATVRAERGAGLAGDRYAARAGFWQDGRVARELTLVAAEVAEDIGIDPRLLRRNIVTRGVRPNQLVGQTFWVGDALCIGTELCEPCRHLEQVTGRSLLRRLAHRGGLRARLLTSGTIAVGDAVESTRIEEGVGVIVSRRGKLLLGRRLSNHGHGTWSFRGGKPVPGEDVLACALRELREETGLSASSGTVVAESTDGFHDSRRAFHTTFVQIDDARGEPQAREPDKTADWLWFEWNQLPQPLFAPVASLQAFVPAEAGFARRSQTARNPRL
jgi:ADP-ribose pyrophosphatase YjhB (NUDIX family)